MVALLIRNNLISREENSHNVDSTPAGQTSNVSNVPGNDGRFINTPNQLANENSARGIFLEGRRNNVLEENCLENNVAQYPEIAKLANSLMAQGAKQISFQLEPNRIVNLEFKGAPVLNRQDYTFSYFIFFEPPSSPIDILSTIQGDGGESSLKFDTSAAAPSSNINAQNNKTFRPYTSHFFSEVPRFLKGKVRLTNTTGKPLTATILFPMMEEGLFPSSPILCGAGREVAPFV